MHGHRSRFQIRGRMRWMHRRGVPLLLPALMISLLLLGLSSHSAEAKGPDRPTNVVLTPQLGALDVSWSAPEAGAPITAYRVRYRAKASKGPWTFLDASGTSRTITGLKPGYTYLVRVQGLNGTQKGRWSLMAEALILGRPAKAAQPSVTASVDSLAVSWGERSDGGSPITHYRVRYRTKGVGSWTFLESSERSVSVSDLATNVTYQVRVQAVNAYSRGNWSLAGVATTAAAEGAPKQPAAPKADVLGPRAVRVAWKPPDNGGAPIESYELRYRQIGAEEWNLKSVDGDSQQADLLLPRESKFEMDLRASNQNGLSPRSTMTSGTNVFVGVKQVVNFEVRVPSADYDYIHFTWDHPDNWTSGPFGPASIASGLSHVPLLGRWTCTVTGSGENAVRNCKQAFVHKGYRVQYLAGPSDETWEDLHDEPTVVYVADIQIAKSDFAASTSYTFRIATIPWDADGVVREPAYSAEVEKTFTAADLASSD